MIPFNQYHNKRVEEIRKSLEAELLKRRNSFPGESEYEKIVNANKDPSYRKLVDVLLNINSLDLPKYDIRALRYYVRFKNPPKSGKSGIHYGGKKYGEEKGVSVYPAVWDKETNKWKILSGGEQYITGLGSFVVDHEDGKIPAYLIYSQEIGEVGEDGEPLLDIADIKIVKKLDRGEYDIEGW